jgi:nucleolar protein 9
MPRENRKRGKKHKKQPDHGPEQQHEEEPEPLVDSLDKPSWIISGAKEVEETNPEAPYGYVDADIKAYFRTVDVQIRDWQESRDEDAGEAGDTDPNDRMMLS